MFNTAHSIHGNFFKNIFIFNFVRGLGDAAESYRIVRHNVDGTLLGKTKWSGKCPSGMAEVNMEGEKRLAVAYR